MKPLKKICQHLNAANIVVDDNNMTFYLGDD